MDAKLVEESSLGVNRVTYPNVTRTTEKYAEAVFDAQKAIRSEFAVIALITSSPPRSFRARSSNCAPLLPLT